MVIDHQAPVGRVLGADDRHSDGSPSSTPLDRLHEAPARDRLVGDHQHVRRPARRAVGGSRLHHSRLGSPDSSPGSCPLECPLASPLPLASPPPVVATSEAAGTVTFARSPLRTACTAPGTPYSYGPPTTCGISSKLKIGGGDKPCHSSVCARHGFAPASGPRAHETIML